MVSIIEQIMETSTSVESELSSSDTLSCDKNDPKKLHKCPHEKCEKRFFRPSKLKDHIRTHTGEKPFKCVILNCGKSYHRSGLLKKHENEVHLNKIEYTVCQVDGCGLALRQSSLQKHIQRKHKSSTKWNFKCLECDEKFPTKKALRTHVDDIHKTILRCDEKCNTKPPKKYVCLCTAKFDNFNIFRTHKKDCEFTKPKCNICNKQFVRLSNLKEHINFVHLELNEVFKCPFEGCIRQYLRGSSLKLHIAKFHNQKKDDYQFECSICPQIIKNERDLWRHMKNVHMKDDTETKVKKKRCPRPRKPMLTKMTGIKYKPVDDTNKSSLTNEPDAEASKAQCNICNAKLKNIINLKKHIVKNHTISKTDHICPFQNCIKQFLKFGALKCHIALCHNGEVCELSYPKSSKTKLPKDDSQEKEISEKRNSNDTIDIIPDTLSIP